MTPRKLNNMFTKMAELKLAIKENEAAYKALEKVALDETEGMIEHKMGKFIPSERTYYSVIDKQAVVKEMGLKSYKEQSTITKAGIERGIGSKGFKKLFKHEAVKVKSVSNFFQFKPLKA